jgi:glucosamine--fructose-6-phosphate aminotransferase (isomerizing)
MLTETRETPDVVRGLLDESGAAIDALAELWRNASIRTVATVARGSSDHAANFVGYLLMAQLGVVATSLPPSVITLHQAPINTQFLAALSFSQSGRSPDLIDAMTALRARGASTAALVNDMESPLAHAVQSAIDLRAGEERSVAATKSFIAQLTAGVRLLAAWSRDAGLRNAVDHLPASLDLALLADWSVGVDFFRNVDRLLVVSRGAGLFIAHEMALKLKEVCGIQAEAFSSAEVKHGPMALIDAGYPVLVMAPRGPAQAGLMAVADELRTRGGRILLAAPRDVPGAQLPIADTPHEFLDGIAAIQSFYPMVEKLARTRGLDPDRPRHLSKVTQTQ